MKRPSISGSLGRESNGDISVSASSTKPGESEDLSAIWRKLSHQPGVMAEGWHRRNHDGFEIQWRAVEAEPNNGDTGETGG